MSCAQPQAEAVILNNWLVFSPIYFLSISSNKYKLLWWFSDQKAWMKMNTTTWSGHWDIQIFILWGHLHWNLFWLWFGPISLCLKFEEDPLRGCWDIPICIVWGHLPIEVVFPWRSSSLNSFWTLVWSHELMFKIC